MKKINYLIAAMAALALFACTGSGQYEEPVAQMADYKGTVTIVSQGTSSDIEDIAVNFTPSEDGKTASIIMYKISFAPGKMPPMDITIPQVNLTAGASQITLSCDQVAPLALGGEFPNYMVTALNGSIKDDILDFSLNFGSTPTSFKGTKQ